MRKGSFLAILISFALILSACGTGSSGGGVSIDVDDEILESFDKSLVKSSNEFGFDIFGELYNEDENLIYSPVSIFLALSMTYNGAEGETREEMAEVLKVRGVDPDGLNKNNLALLYYLVEDISGIELNLANSLWLREGREFNPDFVEDNEKHYNAAIRHLESAEIINTWVEDNTGGHIKDMVADPLSPQTVLILINAIHFLGEWTHEFDKDRTEEGYFNLANGEEEVVSFMQNNDSYKYYSDERFESIRLPYGEDERMAMYIFLPRENLDMSMDIEVWEEIKGEFEMKEGFIKLPRFEIEYEKVLNETLYDLGMESAFDMGRADFRHILKGGTPGDLFISEAKHKAFIAVDEEGTEAAAATSVIMDESAPMMEFEMIVDRPFYFMMHDEKTDCILFVGTYSTP